MKQRPRWREGRVLLYGQVEKQQPHFSFNLVCSLLSLACTWFCATFASEFRLSHLDVHKHLHYSTPPASSSYRSAVYSLTVWLWVESTPPPPHPLRPPLYLQSQQLLRPGQTETITATESTENTSARRTAVMHLLDVFPLFFTLSPLSPSPRSPTTQPWQKLWHNDPRNFSDRLRPLICRCVCVCLCVRVY